MSMQTIREQRIVGSALWAAYGDAIGFMTELADIRGVKHRTGVFRVETTMPWTRRVGGKFGAQVALPPGCYSDDTQLRLCTSRSIRSDGNFDVEAFAKVELPVWLSYSLGAGRGSKAGAAALTSSNTNWFSNFFITPNANYMQGGGNGAAMRIQPHVWASRKLSDLRSYLPDVLRNSLCTHGHMRALIGAVIHARVLALVLIDGEIPHPDCWSDLGIVSSEIEECLSSDNELSAFWIPTWETLSGRIVGDAIKEVVAEWIESVESIKPFLNGGLDSSYEHIVEKLGGLTDAERGSGLKTTLLSLVATWLFRDENPHLAITCIANLLQSDTDTIATMAGALLGARRVDVAPIGDLQDRDLLVSEALRLSGIANAQNVDEFQYPDLLYWQPPKSALDAVGLIDDAYALAGLGYLHSKSDKYDAVQKGTTWQWYELPFGQTVLCKRRSVIRQLPSSVFPGSFTLEAKNIKKVKTLVNLPPKGIEPKSNLELFQSENQDLIDSAGEVNIDDLTTLAIRSGFEPHLIGKHLLSLAADPNGVERSIAYAAIMAKALRARSRKSGGV